MNDTDKAKLSVFIAAARDLLDKRVAEAAQAASNDAAFSHDDNESGDRCAA